MPGHTFLQGDVLRRRKADPIWSLAYLVEYSSTTFRDVLTPENFGTLLVVNITADGFSIAKGNGLVSLPNHRLGEAGDLLCLDWNSSPSRRGKLTNATHRPGDPRVFIATVYDDNAVYYNPDNGYEVVT